MKVISKIKNKLLQFIYSEEKYAKTVAVSLARKKGVMVGEGCRLYSTNFSSEPYLITIGDNVTVASGVRFLTHDGAVHVIRSMDDKYKYANILGKIEVGSNVFIGVDSILLPGISIGDNSIIAAGSVVTKSYPQNSVIAGVPSKKIKDLNGYFKDNQSYLVNTKNLDSREKREFILEQMETTKFKKT